MRTPLSVFNLLRRTQKVALPFSPQPTTPTTSSVFAPTRDLPRDDSWNMSDYDLCSSPSTLHITAPTVQGFTLPDVYVYSPVEEGEESYSYCAFKGSHSPPPSFPDIAKLEAALSLLETISKATPPFRRDTSRPLEELVIMPRKRVSTQDSSGSSSSGTERDTTTGESSSCETPSSSSLESSAASPRNSQPSRTFVQSIRSRTSSAFRSMKPRKAGRREPVVILPMPAASPLLGGRNLTWCDDPEEAEEEWPERAGSLGKAQNRDSRVRRKVSSGKASSHLVRRQSSKKRRSIYHTSFRDKPLPPPPVLDISHETNQRLSASFSRSLPDILESSTCPSRELQTHSLADLHDPLPPPPPPNHTKPRSRLSSHPRMSFPIPYTPSNTTSITISPDSEAASSPLEQPTTTTQPASSTLLAKPYSSCSSLPLLSQPKPRRPTRAIPLPPPESPRSDTHPPPTPPAPQRRIPKSPSTRPRPFSFFDLRIPSRLDNTSPSYSRTHSRSHSHLSLTPNRPRMRHSTTSLLLTSKAAKKRKSTTSFSKPAFTQKKGDANRRLSRASISDSQLPLQAQEDFAPPRLRSLHFDELEFDLGTF